MTFATGRMRVVEMTGRRIGRLVLYLSQPAPAAPGLEEGEQA